MLAASVGGHRWARLRPIAFAGRSITVSSSVSMKSRQGDGGQGQRRSVRRGDGRSDPVDRVVLAAAEVLNAWRSMPPARRPGHARSWLAPSWSSGLVLARFGPRLVGELVADSTLRTHVRARLALPALSDVETALLDARAHVIDARRRASNHND